MANIHACCMTHDSWLMTHLLSPLRFCFPLSHFITILHSVSLLLHGAAGDDWNQKTNRSLMQDDYDCVLTILQRSWVEAQQPKEQWCVIRFSRQSPLATPNKSLMDLSSSLQSLHKACWRRRLFWSGGWKDTENKRLQIIFLDKYMNKNPECLNVKLSLRGRFSKQPKICQSNLSHTMGHWSCIITG